MDKTKLIDIIRKEAISLGLNPDNYTAALYATAGEESSFDPTARQVLDEDASDYAKNLRLTQSDDEFLSSSVLGKGFGLFQFDGKSKNGFYEWTKENNLNPNSPEAQVKFALLDSTGNLDKKYNDGSFFGVDNARNLAATMEKVTPEQAAILFRKEYIKPKVFNALEQQQQLSHLDEIGIKSKTVLPLDVAEQTQKSFEPVAPTRNEQPTFIYEDEEGKGSRYTIVNRGDTLSKIADRTGLSVSELLKQNPQIENADLIKPGEKVFTKKRNVLSGVGDIFQGITSTITGGRGTRLGLNEGGLSLSKQMEQGFMTREPSGTVEQPTRKTASDVLKKLDESKVDIAKGAAEFIPGVGEAMAVKRVSDAMDEKDYTGAAIETAAGALGLIPVVGDAAGKGLRALKKAEDTVPVFPKPERMFPEGERPKGGKYLNPITGEDLTGKNVPNANIKINPDGKPSFNVTNKNVEEVGTKGKGNTQIKTNLFKSKAGWKWKTSDIDTDNINTLISVNTKGKHYYTLETDFSKGVNLKNYPEQKTEPKLRPTVQGQIELGKPIGTISVRGVEHPVYDKVITFAEGGAVPMKEQMSMFEDGGLMDEGNTIDPVSGNDVPPGSTQEEVRDDIPAQLSEGEFVFPADVVRYIGLEKLMRMRQEAKMGLAAMEAMGQMGNSEEAVMPDDLPFDMYDLDIDDDPVEMQVGGFVPPTYTPPQQKQFTTISAQTPVPTFQQLVPNAPQYTQPTTQQEEITTEAPTTPTAPTAPVTTTTPAPQSEPRQTIEQKATVPGAEYTSQGAVDKSAMYDEYGLKKGNITDFYSGLAEIGIGAMIPGFGLVKNIFDKAKETGAIEEPQQELTPEQKRARMQAEYALGTAITGDIGYKAGDVDPKTGLFYNRYGVPVDPKSGIAYQDKAYTDPKAMANIMSAGNKAGWRGGYIGTKDSNAYKNLSDAQKERYDNFLEQLDVVTDNVGQPELKTFVTVEEEQASGMAEAVPGMVQTPGVANEMQQLGFEDVPDTQRFDTQTRAGEADIMNTLASTDSVLPIPQDLKPFAEVIKKPMLETPESIKIYDTGQYKIAETIDGYFRVKDDGTLASEPLVNNLAVRTIKNNNASNYPVTISYTGYTPEEAGEINRERLTNYYAQLENLKNIKPQINAEVNSTTQAEFDALVAQYNQENTLQKVEQNRAIQKEVDAMLQKSADVQQEQKEKKQRDDNIKVLNDLKPNLVIDSTGKPVRSGGEVATTTAGANMISSSNVNRYVRDDETGSYRTVKPGGVGYSEGITGKELFSQSGDMLSKMIDNKDIVYVKGEYVPIEDVNVSDLPTLQEARLGQVNQSNYYEILADKNIAPSKPKPEEVPTLVDQLTNLFSGDEDDDDDKDDGPTPAEIREQRAAEQRAQQEEAQRQAEAKRKADEAQALREQRAAQLRAQQEAAQRKKDKKDEKKKVVKKTGKSSGVSERVAREKKEIEAGTRTRYSGGRAKGGLMEKEVKQPKQMRSGGLASKN
jgi:LysM repeat protein